MLVSKFQTEFDLYVEAKLDKHGNVEVNLYFYPFKVQCRCDPSLMTPDGHSSAKRKFLIDELDWKLKLGPLSVVEIRNFLDLHQTDAMGVRITIPTELEGKEAVIKAVELLNKKTRLNIKNFFWIKTTKEAIMINVKDDPEKPSQMKYTIIGPMKLPAELSDNTTGIFNFFIFKFPMANYFVLVKGDIRDEDNILVRIESACIFGHIFGSKKCDCGPQLHESMKLINELGKGLIIYAIDQDGRGIGNEAHLKAEILQENGLDTVEANLRMGFDVDERKYDECIEIIRFYGLKKIRLLTNNPSLVEDIEKGEIVIQRVPLEVVELDDYNSRYLMAKKDRMGHLLSFKTNQDWMNEALELAKKGQHLVPDEPLVGCVIVRNYTEKVGEGYYQESGGPHAEIQALKQAEDKAKGATMYVTLSPCWDQGRTGPCTEAIHKAGVKKVVVAMQDPNPANHYGIDRLERALGIEVVIGVLEKEAQAINQHWIEKYQEKR